MTNCAGGLWSHDPHSRFVSLSAERSLHHSLLAGVGIGSYSLSALQVTDFEIIDTGPTVALTYVCVRSHPILLDGFELGDLSRWTVVPP